MPNHSTIAIANEFIKRTPDGFTPNQMQIQKLVHIANGWNLAINREPLVDALPEAWDGGPVFRGIWNAVKFFGHDPYSRLLKDGSGVPTAMLSTNETAIIDHVWRKYSRFSGLELSEMTHQPQTPWTETYFSRGRNALIPNDLTRSHYIQLALAGRG